MGYQSIALDGLRLPVLIRAGAKLGLRGRGKEIDLPCPECVCTIVAKGGFQVWLTHLMAIDLIAKRTW